MIVADRRQLLDRNSFILGGGYRDQANHINAMDLNRDYSDVDPIIEKSQFLQSLCEQIIAGHHFAKGQQSIIDRCTEMRVRRSFIR